jgi:hypothetical protein
MKTMKIAGIVVAILGLTFAVAVLVCSQTDRGPVILRCPVEAIAHVRNAWQGPPSAVGKVLRTVGAFFACATVHDEQVLKAYEFGWVLEDNAAVFNEVMTTEVQEDRAPAVYEEGVQQGAPADSVRPPASRPSVQNR